jgi:hypothetical protein
MKWTTKRPRRVGYYWFRQRPCVQPWLRRIRWYRGALFADNMMLDLVCDLNQGCQWAGPAQPPEEASE